jgi:putative acetyltransferase
MDILIRPIRPEDQAAIYEARLQPNVQRFTLAFPSERPKDFVSAFGSDDHVFVAEVDGRAVGIAGLHGRPSKKQRYVAMLGMMVHDAFAGRGVGAALLAQLLEVADNALGLVRVELDVFADNERAIRLYRRAGFVEEGRARKAYFRDGEHIDALWMARVK